MQFKFGSAKCGFKKTGKLDLAVVYSPFLCSFAGVFTTNQIHAACIDENKNMLERKQKIRALIVNSGNANACTGKKGVESVKKTKQLASIFLGIKASEVLVASTGGIGVQLDMEKFERGLKEASLKLTPKKFDLAATAILTTDQYKKTFKKKTKDFYLYGFAKGAGMIHPNMATMLCYLMTDLSIPQALLQKTLKEVINKTFNVISVDGDTSTNDMVILISDNSSKKKVLSEKSNLYKSFVLALEAACLKLAKDIVMDGEGATKIINVQVTGAKNSNDGKVIARHISTSNLFKCAIFGNDPNWGRAVARVGDTKVKINPDRVDISICGVKVFENGQPLNFNKVKLSKIMKSRKEILVLVNLKLGKYSGCAYGSDLTYEYVKLNSDYFT